MRALNTLVLILLLAGCHRVAPYAAIPATDASTDGVSPQGDGSQTDVDGGIAVAHRIEMALGGDEPLVHGACRAVKLTVVGEGVGEAPYGAPLDIGLWMIPNEGGLYSGSTCEAEDRLVRLAYEGVPATFYFKYSGSDAGALTQAVELRALSGRAEVRSGSLAVRSRAPAVMVAAGPGHSCAVAAGGIQCWGGNDRGQLGNGSRGSTRAPGRVLLGDNAGSASYVAAGAHHSCGVVGGAAFCWGIDNAGQLGDGDPDSNARATRLAPAAVIGLSSGVTQVGVGTSHTCALRNGGVWCWGSDWTGQLGSGVGSLNSARPVSVTGLAVGVLQISAADNHTCALMNNEVWCWGRNSSGALGQDPVDQVFWEPVPVALPAERVVARVVAGSAHSCAVVDGGVMCWGANGQGQLGATSALRPDPDWVDGLGAGSSVVDLAAGHDHTCAVTAEGRVLCWGANQHGQVGVVGVADQRAAVEVQGISDVSRVAASAGHTCAVARGVVHCWGRGDSGQLGALQPQLASRPRPVVGLGVVTEGTGGEGFTCAVTVVNGSGRVLCWGRNEYGQLGDGGLTTRAEPAAVSGLPNVTQLAAGKGHACAASDSPARVHCWGQNYLGQLGTGGGGSSLVPLSVDTLRDVGVGDLSSSGRHTCAVAGGQTGPALLCWGRNGAGQLGDGTENDRSLPMAVDWDELDDYPADDAVPELVSTGAAHTCAVVSGGVSCWGSNYDGQCGEPAGDPIMKPDDFVPGFPPGSNDVTAVATGEFFSCALKAGRVTCWGRNWSGELGRGDYDDGEAPSGVVRPNGVLLVGITELVAGDEHACARDDEGGVFCWGANASGQLGSGTSVNSAQAVQVAGLPPAESIFAGSRHSCAVVAGSHLLWCWGSNAGGGIGQPWAMRAAPRVVAPWAAD